MEVRVRSALLLLVGMVCVLPCAFGQNRSDVWEAFGFFGEAGTRSPTSYAFWDEDRIHTYGGGIGIRPFARDSLMRGFGAEFELSGWPEKPTIQLARIQYTGSVVYHFSDHRVEPYFLIGAGGFHVPGNSSPPIGAPFRSTNAFVMTAGFGGQIFLSNRISIRVEYRAFWPRDETDFGRGSIGLGYHW